MNDFRYRIDTAEGQWGQNLHYVVHDMVTDKDVETFDTYGAAVAAAWRLENDQKEQ